jgi:3-methyladenine DNA glycosylase AlkD
MEKDKFIKEYKKYLKANQNPERAAKEKQYLYSDLKHYGVSVWERRKYENAHKKEIKSLSKKEVLVLVNKLWSDDYFEVRSMGLAVLNVHAEELNKKDMPLIEKLMRERKGWAFLDSLIIPVMPFLLTKDESIYKYLTKWIKDDDFWVRRSALLSQLLFFRKGEGGDKELFFSMAKDQFDENWIDRLYLGEERKRAKFFIRKAIGWTLREMSVKDPMVVYKFLNDNKNEMSGLSFKEGSRKLPNDLQDKLNA